MFALSPPDPVRSVQGDAAHGGGGGGGSWPSLCPSVPCLCDVILLSVPRIHVFPQLGCGEGCGGHPLGAVLPVPQFPRGSTLCPTRAFGARCSEAVGSWWVCQCMAAVHGVGDAWQQCMMPEVHGAGGS